MKTTISLTVSLLLLVTPLVSAQHTFGFSITAAPTFSYANTTQTVYLPAVYLPTAPVGSTDPVPVTLSNKIHSWGYLAGVMIHYTFTPNWSASTGFWYYRSSRNGIFPFAPGDIPACYITRILQIPLLLNYRSNQKQLSPYFSVGALASFLQPTIFRPESGSGLDDAKVSFNESVTYRAVLGAGISYRFNSRLSLIAQPLLVWNFKPNDTYSHYTSYQVNGQTQLLYSF